MKRIITTLFAAVLLTATGCHSCDICDDCGEGGCGTGRGHCCGSSPAYNQMVRNSNMNQLPSNMAQVPQGNVNR